MDAIRNLDRNLLAVYLIGILALLFLPIMEPQFRVFGIRSDKWLHFASFCGFAMLFRWALHDYHRATAVAAGVTLGIAGFVEIVQGLLPYRNADLWDLLAGLMGASIGAIVMNHVMASPAPQKRAGVLMVVVGMTVAAVSVLADVIGAGNPIQFGPHQVAGVLLGGMLAAGGFVLYSTALRRDR